MKPTLQLKISQHLALTPQLQQAIRLLQLSTLELDSEVEQFLQDNPMLERIEADEQTPVTVNLNSPSALPDSEAHADSAAQEASEHGDTLESERYEGEYAAQEDWGSEMRSTNPRDANDEDERDYSDSHQADISLRQHLHAQLGLMPINDQQRMLVQLLIEALDEDGYLGQELSELVALLQQELAAARLTEALTQTDADDHGPTPDAPPPGSAGVVSAAASDTDPGNELLEELGIALRLLQSLDPAGVGARNLSESLQLQLHQHPDTATRALALRLVSEHLELLAARDFMRLKRNLRCNEDQLRAAHTLIKTLNPRPGAQYARLDTRYVVPDVTVRKQRGQWQVSLNQDAMPRLRINRLYANLLRQGRSQGQSAGNLQGQLQEARWLIKNVKQRFDTILRVSQAIVERQSGFLEHGEVAMRPLTLREIAETVDLHESTISRVTNQKYMATPRGIFELKYFFGSHVATEAGGAASSTAIRALIKQLIADENPKKPSLTPGSRTCSMSKGWWWRGAQLQNTAKAST